MKVRELIEILKDCDQEAMVIMSSDSEGNGYSPLSDVSDEYNYEADCSYCGEVRFKTLTPELKEEGYGEEDCGDGESAVVLYPTN